MLAPALAALQQLQQDTLQDTTPARHCWSYFWDAVPTTAVSAGILTVLTACLTTQPMLCQAQPSSGDTTSTGDNRAVTVRGATLLQHGCDVPPQQLPKREGSFQLLPPRPRWQCLAVQALLSAGQG